MDWRIIQSISSTNWSKVEPFMPSLQSTELEVYSSRLNLLKFNIP